MALPTVTLDARAETRLDWQVRLGVGAGCVSGFLGLGGFALALLAPRDALERAANPVWLTAALLSWLSTLLAAVFLFGWAATARRPPLTGRLGLALALIATAAASMRHVRTLVDYAAFGLDPGFASRLQNSQTAIATAAFVGIALVAAGGWLLVALTVTPATGTTSLGRALVAVAGLGLMLPLPVTAVALLAASAMLRPPRRPGTEPRESRPRQGR